MKQQSLGLSADPLAVFIGYLGAGHERVEGAARDFLCWNRVLCANGGDVPERVLLQAAAAIWTPEELAELRALQAAMAAAHGDAWRAAWKAESLCRARLMRRVSPALAAYWEGGWR